MSFDAFSGELFEPTVRDEVRDANDFKLNM